MAHKETAATLLPLVYLFFFIRLLLRLFKPFVYVWRLNFVVNRRNADRNYTAHTPFLPLTTPSNDRQHTANGVIGRCRIAQRSYQTYSNNLTGNRNKQPQLKVTTKPTKIVVGQLCYRPFAFSCQRTRLISTSLLSN